MKNINVLATDSSFIESKEYSFKCYNRPLGNEGMVLSVTQDVDSTDTPYGCIEVFLLDHMDWELARLSIRSDGDISMQGYTRGEYSRYLIEMVKVASMLSLA